MIKEVGYCTGIENYSRHLSGKKEGEPPETLLSYFPHKSDGSPDFLTVIDESHVAVPQIRGMYNGDHARKKTLVEYGFRLPSAIDNRPLKFPEFNERVGQVIYTSATPSEYELNHSLGGSTPKSGRSGVVEQIIRPTGLVDPEITVRPIVEKKISTAGSNDADPICIIDETKDYKGQIHDFIDEAEIEIKKGNRVIATTLTKRMAEDLSVYLKEKGLKAEYLHSEIKTINRIKILTDFRKGEFDCLVGVNLLREGLDLPEVTLIGILDADKEGFLRSEVSLIQTIGRAARNTEGRVILYADRVTGSMDRAIGETKRRRKLQIAYNKKHNITPKTIKKKIHDITEQMETAHDKRVKQELEMDKEIFGGDIKKLIKLKEKKMADAVKVLDFETAAILRDEIAILKKNQATK